MNADKSHNDSVISQFMKTAAHYHKLSKHSNRYGIEMTTLVKIRDIWKSFVLNIASDDPHIFNSVCPRVLLSTREAV